MVTRSVRPASIVAWLSSLALIASCAAPARMDGGTESGTDAVVDATPCRADMDCDDQLFCNGVERCMPGAAGADARGCAPATPATHCLATQTCDEVTDRCTTSCAMAPDADGDGHRAAECGGDDCDDSDSNRFPGNTEICDVNAHDEDCDAVTFGFRDADGDGSADARCCNVAMDGMRTCGRDCDDNAPTVNPSSPEVCDGLDNNCDGMIDEGVLGTFYRDADGDGFGTGGGMSMMSCHAPTGYSSTNTDCNDTNPSVHPGAAERCDAAMLDEDCDGVANPPTQCACVDGTSRVCSLAGACSAGTESCVSGQWGACSIMPIVEICNGVDDNCDGSIDELLTVQCYPDGDNDGYAADGATASSVCPVPGRELVGGCPPNQTNREPVAGTIDCAPTNSAVNPGAFEVCDAAMIDEDCDGTANPASLCMCTAPAVRPCALPGACAAGTQMCASGAWGACSIIPVAEVCNGIDDNCDGTTDEALTVTCYVDGDNDGYPAIGATSTEACPDASRASVGGCPIGTTNRVPMGTEVDCNDTAAATSPVATETCNGVDDNCNATIDEMLTVACYADSDGDTFAAAGSMPVNQCPVPGRTMVGGCAAGFTNVPPATGAIDCNDSNVAQSPTATETCNSVDDNCNGTVDEMLRVTCYADGDDDTYAPMGATATPVCPSSGRTAVGGCPAMQTNRAPATGAIDCNDASSTVNPSAGELCDGAMVDENCNGMRNEGCTCTGTSMRSCGLPGACAAGTQTCTGGMWSMCSISPIPETCDNVDNDCDGMIDEGLRVVCYADADNDGYAPSGTLAMAAQCIVPGRTAVGGCPNNATNVAPTSTTTTDCNDANPAIHPNVTELCNGRDDDCSGAIETVAEGTTACSGPNLYGICRTANCYTTACVDGHADCDGSRSNGCEVDTFDDANNCGACGAVCAPGSTCRYGVCDGIVNLAVGPNHTCALHASGRVICWGLGTSGQLGNGTMTTSTSPVTVTGLTDAVGIAVGATHSCARRAGGTVACWGANDVGQLGTGVALPGASTATWVQVAGLSAVAQLSAGGSSTCAVLTSGAVRCWGSNSRGQLGDGTTTNRSTSVVVMGITGAAQVAVGSVHACARTGSGSVECWGSNGSDQLGNGGGDSYTARGVSGISNVTDIAAGGSHSCAVGRYTSTTLGTLYGLFCWGRPSSYGRGGTVASPYIPYQVASQTEAQNVVAGESHTCYWNPQYAGSRDACVGSITQGSPFGRTAAMYSNVGNTACARAQNGEIDCWGTNNYGQTGDGTTTTPRTTPVRNLIETVSVVESVTGDTYGCARYLNGILRCWGSDPSSAVAGDSVPGIADARSMTAGDGAMCVVHGAGAVSCWGANTYGQLGRGTTTTSSTPADAIGIADALEVATTGNVTCARRVSGAVTCWGRGSGGGLGDGTTASRSTPGASATGFPSVLGLPVELAAENDTLCARVASGSVACWGVGTNGQLGNGAVLSSSRPVATNTIDDALGIGAGGDHACVVRHLGAVWCWGDNTAGQLGDGTRVDQSAPVSARINASDVSGGDRFTCVRHNSGAVECVGDNAYGQLGNGSTTDSLGWVANSITTTGSSMGANENYACSLQTGGSVRCWGHQDVTAAGTTPTVIAGIP